MIKVAVDAVGGDFFPQNPVQGAIQAVGEDKNLAVILVGPEKLCKDELEKQEYAGDRISVFNAPDIITMDDSPAAAVKNKPQASIPVGLTLHAKGQCDAFVSAGNTGALLAASAFILGRLEGVMRPSISSVFPTVSGFRLMVDVGANLEVKPEMLYQFALMGEVYAREVMQIETPRVGLLNVGEEDEKGTEVIRKAHELLRAHPRFIGNVEGRDILSCAADVFVCDGLVGNILLKFGESFPDALKELVKQAVVRQKLSPEVIQAVMGILKEALSPFDYQSVGGVPFLGVNGVSFVGHGGSSPLAIKNMIHNATRMVSLGVNDKIVAYLNTN
jgi:glycerol-3-phosphate acyltransferase PlsX